LDKEIWLEKEKPKERSTFRGCRGKEKREGTLPSWVKQKGMEKAEDVGRANPTAYETSVKKLTVKS